MGAQGARPLKEIGVETGVARLELIAILTPRPHAEHLNVLLRRTASLQKSPLPRTGPVAALLDLAHQAQKHVGVLGSDVVPHRHQDGRRWQGLLDS